MLDEIVKKKAADPISLDDKYTALTGRILLSGPQALVRLPMLQHLHDKAAGLNTGGFVSGYQGSPLGTYDMHLTEAKQYLLAHNVHFQPAVNEDLAATACWGTQQLVNFGAVRVDGVFALWYGKGPGVDRSADAIKHANHSGTHPRGGVLAVFGDDHAGKSSTIAHQSDQAFAANSVPVIYPSTVQEYFEFGLFGWALSRYSGLWVGFKTVNETVEQTQTVQINVDKSRIVIPTDGVFPPEGVHYRSAYTPALNDILVTRFKLPLVHVFARANSIDRSFPAIAGAHRIGIVAAGKSYQDVVQALFMLGIPLGRATQLGIGVYKPGLIWPLEPDGLSRFAAAHEELLFIEEKKAFLEPQATRQFYNQNPRPLIVGKYDECNVELLPSDVPLSPALIATVIGQRLQRLHMTDARLDEKIAECRRRASDQGSSAALMVRSAFYCSGCPHNTSTQLPEGSQAMGGIGCHGMATFTRQDTLGVTHMGGEGATWYGVQRFTNIDHVFQNLGDGTYYHSGLLAIRGAVAAGVSITYKILFNDATAMTGGQPLAGPLSVGDITRQALSEGVKKVVVVTDRPELYNAGSKLAPGVLVRHRDELDAVQREFREIPGTTVIVYEQTCAAEKRRRRKRKEFPDPPKRQFINDAVCEGCGDCSAKANCVSIHPLETVMGRKRTIDQSSCNKDYSCVKGFCPSFVTVYGGGVRKPKAATLDAERLEVPTPAVAALAGAYGILIAGIGGTGVVTVGAVLAMAAHLEGKFASAYDMTGMAQKGAAVYSHLKIASASNALGAQKLGADEAQLLLACDLIAGVGDDARQAVSAATAVVVNSVVVPTSGFQKNPDLSFDPGTLEEQLTAAVGVERTHFIAASRLALDLLGDTIGANFILVGFALQSGLLPMSVDSVMRALELNGAAVEFNKQAVRLGRLWSHDPERLQAVWNRPAVKAEIPQTAEGIQRHREAFLRDYQNASYAARYARLVEQVRRAESIQAPGRSDLTTAVARYFAKLMAYKDEYEVARLHSSAEFHERLQREFSGSIKLRYNLAPPLFAKRDPHSGELMKREYGAWVGPCFKVLANLRGLRGTVLDPFGRTMERRTERAWISRYEALMQDVCRNLDPGNYADAVELAKLPEMIRGYGHVKERALKLTEARLKQLLVRFQQPQSVADAVTI